MAAQNIDYGTSISVIVGPDALTCAQLRDEIRDLAEEASAKAAQAALAGRGDHAALYSAMQARLTLIAGGRP
jgi:hypothetical protein